MQSHSQAADGGWAIDLSNVTKRFGATVALDNASFRVRRGAVHALLGENGAGKSTTVKLLSGLMQPDEGSISILGQSVNMRGPKDAHRAGVQTAFQEMTLVRDLTVAQNLLMSYEPTGWFGRIRQREAQRQAAEWLDRLELGDVRPGAYIRDLAAYRKDERRVRVLLPLLRLSHHGTFERGAHLLRYDLHLLVDVFAHALRQRREQALRLGVELGVGLHRSAQRRRL